MTARAVRTLRATRPALRAHPAGHALLVHHRGRLDPQALRFAAGLAPDKRHLLVVLDLPFGALEETAPALVRLLAARPGSVRLVPGRATSEQARRLGQELADGLGRLVLVPDGEPLPTGDGGLFIPAEYGAGWLRLRPGRQPEHDSHRFPKPLWEFSTSDRPWETGAHGVAEAVPSGVWVRTARPRDLSAGWRRLVEHLPSDPHVLTIVLGCPGGPAVPLDDVIRVWRSVLPSLRGQVKFVHFGPVAVPGGEALGQALADAIGQQVTLWTDLPLGAGALAGPPARWEPFVKALRYTPHSAAPPELLGLRPPLTGVRQIGESLYEYTAAAVLEVVQAGLWMRPAQEPADGHGVRRIPAAPGHFTLLYDRSGPDGGAWMKSLAEDMQWRLESEARALFRIAPADDPALAALPGEPEQWAVPGPAGEPLLTGPTTEPRRPAHVALWAGTGAEQGEAPAAAEAPEAAEPASAAPALGLLIPDERGGTEAAPAPRPAAAPAAPSLPRESATAAPALPSVGVVAPEPVRSPVPAAVPAAAPAPAVLEAGVPQPQRTPEPVRGAPEPETAVTLHLGAPVPSGTGLPEARPDGPTPPRAEQVPAPSGPGALLAAGGPAPVQAETAEPAEPLPAAVEAAPSRPVPAGQPAQGTEPVRQPARPAIAGFRLESGAPPPAAEAAPAPAPAGAAGTVGTEQPGTGGDPGQVRVQPIPKQSASAVPPEQGLEQEREWVRRTFSAQYHAVAGGITRIMSESPGLRDGSRPAAETLTDLVAVRLYLTGDSAQMDAAVRGATTGPHVPLARCAASGLRRLPSYRGATVLRARLTAAEREWYQVGRPVTDWGFCTAFTTVHPAPEGTTDILIWSITGRRTALLETDVTDRVLFLPGTAFTVLDNIAENGRRPLLMLREVAPNEARPGAERTALDDLALGVLERAAEALRAEAGPTSDAPDHPATVPGVAPGLLGAVRGPRAALVSPASRGANR